METENSSLRHSLQEFQTHFAECAKQLEDQQATAKEFNDENEYLQLLQQDVKQQYLKESQDAEDKFLSSKLKIEDYELKLGMAEKQVGFLQ